MDSKKTTLWFFLSSVVASTIGYVLTNSIKFGICICTLSACDPLCVTSYARIGSPIFFGMGALALILFVLLLVPKATKTWNKFAIWSAPLVALVFLLYPTPAGTDYFTPDPETAFKWVSATYVIISLIIIGFASFSKTKGNK